MLFLIQADLDVDISVHKGIYVQTLGIIKLWETGHILKTEVLTISDAYVGFIIKFDENEVVVCLWNYIIKLKCKMSTKRGVIFNKCCLKGMLWYQ